MDKIRFLALTDKEVLGEGDTAKLEILVSNVFLVEQERFFVAFAERIDRKVEFLGV